MLIHNAIFWLKNSLTNNDLATFEAELKRLAQIPYLERGYAGIRGQTEKRPVTDHTFDYSISFHFKTLADHDFYQMKCKEHARFISVCKDFFDRVIVYDMTSFE